MANQKVLTLGFLLGLVVFINVLFVCVVVFSISNNLKYRRDFKVDEQLFVTNLYQSVDMFLSNYLSNRVSSAPSPAAEPDNITMQFADFGTYQRPSGAFVAVINGSKFEVGDFLEQGLIFKISDGRIYCRSGSKVVILRTSPKERPVSPSPPVPLQRAEGEA